MTRIEAVGPSGRLIRTGPATCRRSAVNRPPIVRSSVADRPWTASGSSGSRRKASRHHGRRSLPNDPEALALLSP